MCTEKNLLVLIRNAFVCVVQRCGLRGVIMTVDVISTLASCCHVTDDKVTSTGFTRFSPPRASKILIFTRLYLHMRSSITAIFHPVTFSDRLIRLRLGTRVWHICMKVQIYGEFLTRSILCLFLCFILE